MDCNVSKEAAEKLFESFHGRKPGPADIVEITFPAEPEICLVIGELDRLSYYTKEDKDPFMHKMGEVSGNRPLLVCTSDGKQIYILKGGYRFTSRGFID